MPEMLSRDEFSTLIERAGLKLDDDQFEAARRSYANLRDLTDLVRVARGRRAESPHIFRVHGPTTLEGSAADDHTPTNEG